MTLLLPRLLLRLRLPALLRLRLLMRLRPLVRVPLRLPVRSPPKLSVRVRRRLLVRAPLRLPVRPRLRPQALMQLRPPMRRLPRTGSTRRAETIQRHSAPARSRTFCAWVLVLHSKAIARKFSSRVLDREAIGRVPSM